MKIILAVFCWILGAFSGGAAGRINQEGRILGAAPAVTNVVLFNTSEADSILSAMQIFPITSAWNEDISRRPLLSNSSAMISQISADLSSTRQTLRAFYEMNFALVPDSQPLVPITFVDYPDESDPGPYPIPGNLPVEGWPTQTGGQTLSQWQTDISNVGGDRHAIIVQPGSGVLRETWQAKLVGTNWQASNGAQFDLKSNAMRPAGWTSGDAAGLPMFPALVRYDECERGMVEHALRLIVKRTRKEYIYPATHYASTTAASQTNVPAMGQRLRLKSSFVIPPTWTKQEKAVLLAFKKYGAIVADNGGFFSISVTPDDRWPSGAFDHLSTLNITNFEVIQTTGPTEGPRSPGAPSAYAGADQSVTAGTPLLLNGRVIAGSMTPVVEWKCVSGPALASFQDRAITNTSVTFGVPGIYTLVLSADDQIHAVAYDSKIVRVIEPAPTLAIARKSSTLALSWTNSTAVVVETAGSLQSGWNSALTTSAQTATFPLGASNVFFRLRAQ